MLLCQRFDRGEKVEEKRELRKLLLLLFQVRKPMEGERK
jgi:hypothetical protein